MQNITLNNGLEMPQMGLGTYLLPEGEITQTAVENALKIGFRHIDTAHAYQNERSVGNGIKSSGVKREDIWISSKLWPNEYEGATEALNLMLQRLQTDYIDMVYLHQPVGNYLKAWQELEMAVKDGKVRALGISNFDFNDELFDTYVQQVQLKPAALQIECHPLAQREHWQQKIKENGGIKLESWYPLGGRESKGEILHHPTIVDIANAHQKSAAQIITRWHLQKGFSVIAGTVNVEHLKENIAAFDFELTAEEMERIKGMNEEKRYFNLKLEEIQKLFSEYKVVD